LPGGYAGVGVFFVTRLVVSATSARSGRGDPSTPTRAVCCARFARNALTKWPDASANYSDAPLALRYVAPMQKSIWWGAGLSIAMIHAAAASTWHVATTGDDAGAGTADAPWRTIQHAADSVAPGDTVVVHAGT
jgi:hypothetical protein